MPVVRIPTPLRPHTGGSGSVDVEGSTVGEALEHAVSQHPALRERLFDGADLRRFVNVFLNDEDIRFMDDLSTPVGPKDEVSIIPAIAGG